MVGARMDKLMLQHVLMDFPESSHGKESTCNAGDIKRRACGPCVGKIPGEGNGNLLQYSCLENPMDRGA